MYALKKQFKFEAAHQLHDHDGKCQRLHGHSWVGWLVLEYPDLVKEGPKRNMAQDYGDIKAVIAPIVDEYLDHHDLNVTVNSTAPTSEFIARWIYTNIKHQLPNLAAVVIEETCTSACEYRPYHAT